MKFLLNGSCHAKLGLEESACCALLGGPRGTRSTRCCVGFTLQCWCPLEIAKMPFKQKSSILLVGSSFSVLKYHYLKSLFHCNTDLPHADSFLPDQTLSRSQHFCHGVWVWWYKWDGFSHSSSWWPASESEFGGDCFWYDVKFKRNCKLKFEFKNNLLSIGS